MQNSEGLYLTAFRDGSIKFYAKKLDNWEKFYILDDEIESVISFTQHKLDINCKIFLDSNRIHVLLGDAVITPSFIPPASLTQEKWFIEYKTLTDKKRLQVDKPLIYFCTYGKDEYYEMLNLSIKSLIQKGKYTGDILIKSDNTDKAKEICQEFENHFIFSEINPELGIFNRYWLHEPCLEEYASIIYFDTDILTINEISNTLKYFQQSDLVSYIGGDFDLAEKYFYEHSKYGAYKWYGLQYINPEYVKKTNMIYHLNSGLFAINDLEKVKPVMDKIIQYRSFEDHCGDQPFFNAALYNSGIDVTTLNHIDNLAFSRSTYQSFKNLDKVLIHYNSGVGRLSKLNLMKETWEYINKQTEPA